MRRFDKTESVTVLNIRFATSEATESNNTGGEDAYIRAQKNNLSLEIEEEHEDKEDDSGILPFLKYKRTESPEQQLRSMGYEPDVRVSSEVYSDKVE